MNINSRMYCDGFFTLSTTANNKRIAVTYSPSTTFEDAIADFRTMVRLAGKRETAEKPSIASPDGSQG